MFYGAEDIETACAEAGYWRLHCWLDSAALVSRSAAIQMTLFEFHGATQWHLDLTLPPFGTQRKAWIHPSDSGKTQEFAARARHENIEMLRAESARNRPDGRCLAILTPAGFRAVAEPFQDRQQTWGRFIQPPNLVVWQRELTGDAFSFEYA